MQEYFRFHLKSHAGILPFSFIYKNILTFDSTYIIEIKFHKLIFQHFRDIHLKRRRVMVDKFHENFRFVDNQLNSMYAKYQHTHPHVCVAITDVSKKIKEALTLIDAEKDSKNISVTTVAQLEQILKSCLSGYENVKQQIGRLV